MFWKMLWPRRDSGDVLEDAWRCCFFSLFAANLSFSKMGGTFDMSWSRGRSWEAVLWADGGLAA